MLVYVLCPVNVEEVRVQHRLHNTRNDGNRLDRVTSEVPVDPIRDIERSVCAESEEVVRRDRLGLACSLQHEELRQDSH